MPATYSYDSALKQLAPSTTTLPKFRLRVQTRSQPEGHGCGEAYG
jgi:hypothetical protein